jgi:hypothetical protein
MNNIYNLPEPLVKALTSERKPPEYGRFSVTSLIDAPLRRCLSLKHFDELEETSEVSDNLWILLGKAVHYVIEQANKGEETEIKIEHDWNGKATIVGVIDYRGGNSIVDWKVTSVYSFIFDKPEWEYQLNVYRYLLEEKGYPVDSIFIYGILRDWTKGDYRKDPDNYPPIPFKEKSIPIWSMSDTYKYIEERVMLHRMAEKNLVEGRDIPQCTPAERWQRPTTYAIAKNELDRAKRVLATIQEAEEYLKTAGTGYKIWERKGKDVKCDDYCSVEPFCPYRNH